MRWAVGGSALDGVEVDEAGWSTRDDAAKEDVMADVASWCSVPADPGAWSLADVEACEGSGMRGLEGLGMVKVDKSGFDPLSHKLQAISLTTSYGLQHHSRSAGLRPTALPYVFGIDLQIPMYTQYIAEPPLINILLPPHRLHPPLPGALHSALRYHPPHPDILHFIARIARRGRHERHNITFRDIRQEPWPSEVADGADEEGRAGEERRGHGVVELDEG